MCPDPKIIRTKGDVNPASIPGTDFPITEKEYIGKVVYTLPQAGYVTQLLKPPINIFSFIIFYGIIFAILAIKHQEYKKNQPAKAQIAKTKDETQFWVCPNCGKDIQMKDGKQFCSSCNVHL